MKIKKLLSAFVASTLIITAFAFPVSAASSLTFSPATATPTYKLKITASVDIMPTVFNINDTLSLSGKVLTGETVSVSSPGKSSYNATILGDDYKPTLNGSPITQKSPLTFGFSAGSANTIIGGTVGKYSWVGYVEFSDKSKHPVNDLGLVLTDLTLGDTISLELPFAGSTSSVDLTKVSGEVVTSTPASSGFEPGSQIKLTDCFGNGKGLTQAQRKEISGSTSKNFTVTLNLDKAITDDFVLFTLTTDLINTTVPVTSTKGISSIKFTAPRDLFYDGDYDVLFSWLKITSTSTAYKYSSIILEYDSSGGEIKDTSPTTDTDADPSDYDEELMINYTAVSLNVGASVNLKTNYDDVSWTSSSSSTVRTFASGKITAVKAGTATITGKNGIGDTVKCKVTVVSSKTPVTTIKLSKKSGTAYRNSSYAIGNMLSVSPSKHTDKITWSSSNTDIATVSSTGKVKVVGTGDVTITVTSSSGKSASILLKCKKPTIKLSKTSATISVGKTTTIGVTSLPSASAITYDSYDEGVATVDEDGVVKGIKAGEAKIIVRNRNGATATFTVTVK